MGKSATERQNKKTKSEEKKENMKMIGGGNKSITRNGKLARKMQ